MGKVVQVTPKIIDRLIEREIELARKRLERGELLEKILEDISEVYSEGISGIIRKKVAEKYLSAELKQLDTGMTQ
jgi:hypothetical protein